MGLITELNLVGNFASDGLRHVIEKVLISLSIQTCGKLVK